jgi:hypothetical protein
MMWITSGISSFYVGSPPPLQPRVVRSFPGMGCMIFQPFATGGNQSYLKFWAKTGDLQYPGFFTLTRVILMMALPR